MDGRHESLKETISQLLSLADIMCCEVLIGIKLTRDRQINWATNGSTMKQRLETDGLHFHEGDHFFETAEMKQKLAGYDLIEWKDEKVAPMIRQTQNG
jgi:hypothetical protein